MSEPLPLATIHDAVLDFLRGRTDAVLFGAQAVNAYSAVSRLTEDVDVMSPRAEALAEEIRQHLNKRFFIATRVRSVRDGLGYRVYQLRKEEVGGNRHLVDVRPIRTMPETQTISGVLVLTPPEVIANKVVAWRERRGKPKAGTDWRDLATMLLTFPELKAEQGPVQGHLKAAIQAGADPRVLDTWRELVEQEITAESDEDEFDN